MFELTSGVRARYGPVHVFNPQGVGGVPSTFRWNPLDGCEDPAVAIRRADAFANSVSQHGVEDASFWSAKASDYLRAYFHAAALAGLDLRHVARWVSSERDQEAEDILYTTAGAATHFAAQLAEMRGEANRTISTVRMTMSRALAFLADPSLAAAVLPDEGQSLDIGQFLHRTGTIYLIAESIGEDAPVAPLFACLATEIHYMAALLGSRMPGGRLDPPLLMALDEGDPDLPGAGAVMAGRLRRQGHPDHHRRPRRSTASQPVGPRRRPGHHGHLRREGLAAGHQRPRHPGDGVHLVRHGRGP
jgi:type IV secretory pathway TraG/TraD family ATPase VirD4